MHLLSGVLVTFFLSTITHAATTIKGTLELSNPNRTRIQVTDNQGQEVQLANGEVEITYQRPGPVGFIPLFTGHRQLLLTQADKTLTFDLYTKDFNSLGDFKTPVNSKTSISLSGHTQTETVDITEQNSSQSCTYSGLCFACSPGISLSGNFEMSCSLKYNLSCNGQEPTLAEVTRYRDFRSIWIVNSNTNEILGMVRLNPTIRSTEKTLKVTGSCN